MFKVGDRAVYPAQGVVEIKAIEAKEFSGEQNEFYILRIINTDMTIMVPIANANTVGMRSLIDDECIRKVFEILKEKKPVNGNLASWSRRQKIYHDKIKSGDPIEVAEVLRELYYIKEDKDLSYGEKKILDQARKLLVQEIAIAQGAPEEQIAEKVEKIFLQ